MLRSIIMAAGRHYPFFSGCGTIANSRLARSGTENLGIQPVMLHRRLPRAQLLVDPTDYVGRSIYYFGDLDPKITWICRQVLRPGDQVMDIGSNHGLIALTAAMLVGPGGHVDAFEPQPRLARLLDQSARLNRLSNISVHQVALGEADGTLDLFVPDDNGGAASFIRQHEPSGTQLATAVRKAGELFTELGKEHIRLMKIDVEGFEASVLRGAAEWLQQDPPDVIVIEANEPERSAAETESASLLKDAGYRLFAVRKTMKRPVLIPLKQSPSEGINDLVAVWHAARPFNERMRS
jgi:FkbM family methyltransferase